MNINGSLSLIYIRYYGCFEDTEYRITKIEKLITLNYLWETTIQNPCYTKLV